MSKTIFLTFANSSENPLPALKEEDKAIYNYLDQRTKETAIKIHRDSYATKQSIREHLNDKKEHLMIFHYSGHAEEATLFLEDGAAKADGIADFLGLAPNLKMVFLNGCKTYGQEAKLVELPSKPVVVFTTAPVNDESAKIFSSTFYQALCQGNNTIQSAFDAAQAAERMEEKEEGNDRGVIARKKVAEEEGIWVLSCQNPNLPNSSFSELLGETVVEYEVNSKLTEKLVEDYEEYNEEVRQVYEADNNSISDLQRAILKALPHPISEQLRKLFAIRIALADGAAYEENVFYDQLGFERLKQMEYACYVLLELVSFIQLSQLWEAIKREKIKVTAEVQTELSLLFSAVTTNTQSVALFKLIQRIDQLFTASKEGNFLEELEVADLTKNESFQGALTFFQTIKEEITEGGAIPENRAATLCIEAEEKMAIIYGKLAFIINYQMDSVQSVKFMSYRHKAEPEYDFEKVELIQNLEKIQFKKDTKKEALNTRSVFLINKKKEVKPLNLTPFLIDENAFPTKRNRLDTNRKSETSIAKISSFNALENYQFRHIYQPKEKMIIKDKSDLKRFRSVTEQVDDFVNIVFGR